VVGQARLLGGIILVGQGRLTHQNVQWDRPLSLSEKHFNSLLLVKQPGMVKHENND
jgi:hypothetical protein